jgi:hypothetical protein
MYSKIECVEEFRQYFPIDKPDPEDMFYIRNDIREYEGNIYRDIFDGMTWIDVIDSIGYKYCPMERVQTLGFMKPKGLNYYTPAFFCYFFNTLDEELMNKYFSSVTLSNDDRFSDKQSEFFSLLDENSTIIFVKVLRDLIIYLNKNGIESSSAERSYENFWKFI